MKLTEGLREDYSFSTLAHIGVTNRRTNSLSPLYTEKRRGIIELYLFEDCIPECVEKVVEALLFQVLEHGLHLLLLVHVGAHRQRVAGLVHPGRTKCQRVAGLILLAKHSANW